MTMRWSSAEISSRDRLPFWIETVCRTLVRLDCEPRRDQTFFGEISHDEIGLAKLATFHSSGQRISRSTKQVADNPADFFHVNVMQHGRGVMTQDGREAELASSGLVLVDMGRPYAIDFPKNFHSIVLRIPRPMLLQHLGKAEPFTVMRVDAGNGLGAMVVPMLRDLPALLPTIGASARERVSVNIVDLVAATLLSTGAAKLSPRLTLTRVKFWIETHLAEKLSGDDIARRCGLSVRRLNRLFAADQTSLMHYVWERRLDRCRRDLADPTLRGRSISDIALASGFNDLAHFSRAYRARFGVTPREARGQD